MYTKQISVFLENQKGRLAEVTRILTQQGINIRALSLADTANFGVLRLIVNEPDRCLRVLREHELVAQETDVIAVEIGDKPGSLHSVVEILECEGLNIEYLYAFVDRSQDEAIVVFKIDDLEHAFKTLRHCGIPILPEGKVENL